MRKFIIIAIAIGLIAGIVWWRISVKNRLNKNNEFSIATVTRKDLTTNVLATGVLEPRLKIQMKSPQRGQVDEILVDEGDKVKKGQSLAWISSDNRITLIDAARVNMEEAKQSGDNDKIIQAEREWKIAREAYQRIPLLSPIDGEVTLRSVEPRQNIDANTVIIGISDKLVVKTQVDETDIGKIKVGMMAKITIDAYPEDTLYGKVTKIAHESTVVSNVTSYEVTVELMKSNKTLKSGMTANVEIIIAQRKNVLVLPLKAVKQRRDEKFVLVPTDKKHPQSQAVVTGLENDQEIEIISGLGEGNKVLISKQTKNNSTDSRTQGQRGFFMPGMGRRH